MSGIEAAFFGALTRAAELKTSQAGKQYLRCNVRIGEGDAAQFINAMVFDGSAIETADKLIKGARVYIEGSLSLNEWTAQDGTMRRGLSVMSWHCRLSQIGRNKSKREKPAGKELPCAAPSSAPVFDDDLPF
jgi:single-stranded DNA-binding protein